MHYDSKKGLNLKAEVKLTTENHRRGSLSGQKALKLINFPDAKKAAETCPQALI